MIESKDTYLTVEIKSNGLFKEKGSKFISFAYPVNNIQTIKTLLTELKKEYYDSRHICYAYRIGYLGEEYRTNDDGEPSGTAGKPIYGQLLSHNLTNIMVVVIRYFGGTKLGVSGLIQAYKNAAFDAITNNKVVERIIYQSLSLSFKYPDLNSVMRLVKQNDLHILSQEFKTSCRMQLAIRRNDFEMVKFQYEKLEGIKVTED